MSAAATCVMLGARWWRRGRAPCGCLRIFVPTFRTTVCFFSGPAHRVQEASEGSPGRICNRCDHHTTLCTGANAVQRHGKCFMDVKTADNGRLLTAGRAVHLAACEDDGASCWVAVLWVLDRCSAASTGAGDLALRLPRFLSLSLSLSFSFSCPSCPCVAVAVCHCCT